MLRASGKKRASTIHGRNKRERGQKEGETEIGRERRGERGVKEERGERERGRGR